VGEHPVSEFFLLGDEVEDALPKNFGDVLALTNLRLRIIVRLFFFRRVVLFSLEVFPFFVALWLYFKFGIVCWSRALLIILCGIFFLKEHRSV
jgi:hypothetical protein